MVEVETFLYTSTERADLFDWQERLHKAHPGKQWARVDTWTIHGHPCPGGAFTLYACTVVLATVNEGEMSRTGITIRPALPALAD